MGQVKGMKQSSAFLKQDAKSAHQALKASSKRDIDGEANVRQAAPGGGDQSQSNKSIISIFYQGDAALASAPGGGVPIRPINTGANTGYVSDAPLSVAPNAALVIAPSAAPMKKFQNAF